MNAFKQLLQSEETILLDGAMGTMLMDAGLEQGNAPELWNVEHPQRVQAVHDGYIAAGSRLILTNTFGGTHFRLKLHNVQDRVAELNEAGARVARLAADAAEHLVVVAGSMGPTGELIEPLGTMTFEEARDAFAEQAAALAAGGVDLLWIETMSDLQEVRAAVEGARAASDLPVAVCMTFDTNRHTMMGVSPQQAAEALSEMNLAAFGANCGNGTAEIEDVMAIMTGLQVQTPLIAKSNAGIPRLVDGGLEYDGTPPVMAGYAYRVQKLGARLIGGCCGSTPVHVRAMNAALSGETAPETLPEKAPTPDPTPAQAQSAGAQNGARNGKRSRRRRERRRSRGRS